MGDNLLKVCLTTRSERESEEGQCVTANFTTEAISVPASAVFYNKDSADFHTHDRSVQGAAFFCGVGEEQLGQERDRKFCIGGRDG